MNIAITTRITAAYVSNNAVSVASLPSLIASIHAILSGLAATPERIAPAEPQVPAVPIRRSVQRDYIVCLEDGKRLKMLKRYLRSKFNLSPDEYRRKWGLAGDYPMVCTAYSEARSALAKAAGLGVRSGRSR